MVNTINKLVIVFLMLSRTRKAKASLTLIRGSDLDVVEGIKCQGSTLNNIPGFGCLCKPEFNTFYEHDGKYCYNSQQILQIEGKPISILLFLNIIFSIFDGYQVIKL